MGLVDIVVGILTEDDDLDVVERCMPGPDIVLEVWIIATV